MPVAAVGTVELDRDVALGAIGVAADNDVSLPMSVGLIECQLNVKRVVTRTTVGANHSGVQRSDNRVYNLQRGFKRVFD